MKQLLKKIKVNEFRDMTEIEVHKLKFKQTKKKVSLWKIHMLFHAYTATAGWNVIFDTCYSILAALSPYDETSPCFIAIFPGLTMKHS